MKKNIQAIEISGTTIYIEVVENINIEESTGNSKNITVASNLDKVVQKTIKASSDIILEPVHIFANQLLESIENMKKKPKKVNLELYIGFGVGTGKAFSYIVADGKAETSLKINLEWEIEKK